MRRKHRPTPNTPYFEALETRELLSIASVELDGKGVLTIRSNDAADQVVVRPIHTIAQVQDQKANTRSGTRSWFYSLGQITKIQYFGKGGNDVFESSISVPTYVDGGPGHDKIKTANAADTLIGGAGNDTLIAGGGADLLYGDHGNDKLYGGAGSDRIFGGAGDDFLDGGSGTNRLDGGAGLDFQAHVWAIAGAVAADVEQRSSETCVFLSSVAAAAHSGINLANRISYLGDGFYNVSLFINNRWTNVRTFFDGSIRPNEDPTPVAEGESWVILLQRAFLKVASNFRHERLSLSAVTGVETNSIDTHVMPFTDADFTLLSRALAQKKAITAGTAFERSQISDKRLVHEHMYTVIGVRESGGQKYVTIRNPWGRNDPAGSGGLLTIKWTDFKRSFDVFHIA